MQLLLDQTVMHKNFPSLIFTKLKSPVVVQLLGEIMPIDLPAGLLCDNQWAAYMANDAFNNKRTKHIDIRYRFISHHVKERLVELKYVPSHLNMADLFTKSLGGTIFTRLVTALYS